MSKENLRPCTAWNMETHEQEEGFFHGWFQTMDGNAEIGLDADVMGVFEDKYGDVRLVYANHIHFTDRDVKPEVEKS